MFIHCVNTECKNYWEDSCTRDLEGEMVCLDGNGHCEDFEKGKSDYYNEEESEKVIE